MSMQAVIADEPAAEGMTPERARVLRERHLAVLEELMEEGLRLSKAIARQGVEPDAPKVVEGNVGLEYDRAVRAVRRSIALRDRLIADMLSPRGAADGPVPTNVTVRFVDSNGTELPRTGSGAAQAAAAPEACKPPPIPPVDPRARKAQVLSAVRKVAAAGLLPGEFSPREASDLVEGRVREVAERLEDGRELDDLLRLPVSEIIDRICRDLGLFPDWERLAEEAWAVDEIKSGRVGAPLKPLSSPACGGGGPRSGGGGATPSSFDKLRMRATDERFESSS